MTLGIGTHTVNNATEVFYFEGHPRYDAVKVTLNSANTASTDTDIDIAGYSDDDPRSADDNSDFSSMDSLSSQTTIDASSSDVVVSTTGATRTMAVEVVENSSSDVEVTIERHNSSDPAQNAEAFVNR